MTVRLGPFRAPGLVLAGLLFAACGPESAPPSGPEDAPAEASAADLVLARLAERVSEGGGISDASWSDDVSDVAESLWPDDVPLKRAHHNLAHIAGDMATWLREEEGARESWLERDPTSVEIHDAFVQAAGGGVEAYRAWVEGEGRALLDKRFQALAGERPPR